MSAIDQIINVAMNEKGYLEKRSNSQLDSKTSNAGSGNYTKYWRDLAPGMNGQSWCQCFVNWVFQTAFGADKAKQLLCSTSGWSYYTPTAAGYFKTKGQWHSSPQKGDIIYFRNSQRICHVGIVYAVDGSHVYTIEGNTSGASGVVANGGGVMTKSYALGYSRIAGYGRPNYSLISPVAKVTKTESVTPKTTEPTNGNSIIQEAQKQANKFVGHDSIATDGVRGNATKKMAVMVLQKGLNKDYNANLTEDGSFGDKTKKALGSHYVKNGEKQYMVSVAEILLGLKGKNPGGYEYPGIFGNGLKKASGKDKIAAEDFISYLK